METTAPNGRPVYVSVAGQDYDDLEIDQAYYTDTPENILEPVPDHIVEQIQEKYADELLQEWIDKKIDKAEDYGDRER